MLQTISPTVEVVDAAVNAEGIGPGEHHLLMGHRVDVLGVSADLRGVGGEQGVRIALEEDLLPGAAVLLELDQARAPVPDARQKLVAPGD